jgi:hypothetical protein
VSPVPEVSPVPHGVPPGHGTFGTDRTAALLPGRRPAAILTPFPTAGPWRWARRVHSPPAECRRWRRRCTLRRCSPCRLCAADAWRFSAPPSGRAHAGQAGRPARARLGTRARTRSGARARLGVPARARSGTRARAGPVRWGLLSCPGAGAAAPQALGAPAVQVAVTAAVARMDRSSGRIVVAA